jgi:hypothetical protein
MRHLFEHLNREMIMPSIAFVVLAVSITIGQTGGGMPDEVR